MIMIFVKAAILEKYKEPLNIDELDVEKPHVGEVRIRIRAAGVCHSDLYVIDGDTPVPPPLVPGHEAVGVVEEVGPGVNNVQPGDVVVTSFIWPCGHCRNCVRGFENLCERFSAVRLRGVLLDGTTRLRRNGGEEVRVFLGGTWAEEAVVPSTAVVKLPDSLSNRPELAILGCAYLTGYGAVVNTGRVSAGDTVAIIGTGGVGLATLQVAKAVGAKVIIIGRNPEKLKLAKELGADYVVNIREVDPVKTIRELTDGRGADVVIEAVGSDETVDQAVEMVAIGGKVVLVGLMAVGHKTPVHVAKVVRAGIQILGSYGARPRVDLPIIIDMVKRGYLTPERLTNHRFKLDEVNEAVKALRLGKAVRPLIVMD